MIGEISEITEYGDLKNRADIPDLLDALRRGECVVLVDDEDRENEGDLVCAAEFCTPEIINFMSTHARGLICLTLTEERCDQLNLKLMEKKGTNPISTNFTESIEASRGITTGISAQDRANTVKAAISKSAKPEDIVTPGHIFPVRSVKGGVLRRAGHTEATCDLMALAGLEPAGVICEIINEDGQMARRHDLSKYAEKHNLKVGVIADLIEYRCAHEKTIEKVQTNAQPTQIETECGVFDLTLFRDQLDGVEHCALSLNINPDTETLVRVHSPNLLQDVVGLTNDTKWTVRKALTRIQDNGHGVLIVLNGGSRPPLGPSEELQIGEEVTEASRSRASRVLGVGAQILNGLGVKKFKVLGRSVRYPSLSGFGLTVTGFEEKP